jgi:hypothetical protein
MTVYGAETSPASLLGRVHAKEMRLKGRYIKYGTYRKTIPAHSTVVPQTPGKCHNRQSYLA